MIFRIKSSPPQPPPPPSYWIPSSWSDQEWLTAEDVKTQLLTPSSQMDPPLPLPPPPLHQSDDEIGIQFDHDDNRYVISVIVITSWREYNLHLRLQIILKGRRYSLWGRLAVWSWRSSETSVEAVGEARHHLDLSIPFRIRQLENYNTRW